MAITICGDRINFDGTDVCAVPTGIDGCMCIVSQCGFCDQRRFQGEVSGYAAGGSNPGATDVIQKFPFTSDTDSTDIAELSLARSFVSGQRSQERGYTSGGQTAPGTRQTTIDRYPFSSDAPATDVAEINQPLGLSKSVGMSSSTCGYIHGGIIGPGSTIQDTFRFPFAAETAAADVNNLGTTNCHAGHSSRTHGYKSGGYGGSPVTVNTICKFSFDSNGSTSQVGFLTQFKGGNAGISSPTHGYSAGGNSPGSPAPTFAVLEKFPFSVDANATDVGEIVPALLENAAGQSSTTNGYTSGGNVNAPTELCLRKFPYASDTPTSNIGTIAMCGDGAAGHQV